LRRQPRLVAKEEFPYKLARKIAKPQNGDRIKHIDL
jgi:hypothetical protein